MSQGRYSQNLSLMKPSSIWLFDWLPIPVMYSFRELERFESELTAHSHGLCILPFKSKSFATEPGTQTAVGCLTSI